MTICGLLCASVDSMKILLHLIPAIAYIFAPDMHLREKPIEKAGDAPVESSGEVILCYDTAERIMAMPRCKAEVEETFSCCVLMRTAEGSRIWIGSPATTAEVLEFLPILQEGVTYTFPDAFLTRRETHRP